MNEHIALKRIVHTVHECEKLPVWPRERSPQYKRFLLPLLWTFKSHLSVYHFVLYMHTHSHLKCVCTHKFTFTPALRGSDDLFCVAAKQTVAHPSLFPSFSVFRSAFTSVFHLSCSLDSLCFLATAFPWGWWVICVSGMTARYCAGHMCSDSREIRSSQTSLCMWEIMAVLVIMCSCQG